MLRKRARKEPTPLSAVYNEGIVKLDPGQVRVLPAFPSMSSAPYRHRRKQIPALPLAIFDVGLNGVWTETADGRPFLLTADGDADRILIFSTDQKLPALQSADSIYMDGTFSSCPELWDQIYILHPRSGSTTYALVYVLLPDRQIDTYCRLFRQLKTKGSDTTQPNS